MSNPKLITRIFGGLGNQLFCYATARRLALANNAELVLDDVSGFAYDAVYQRQPTRLLQHPLSQGHGGGAAGAILQAAPRTQTPLESVPAV